MGPRTALIVGAGIGGLAAGIALRRAGWRVRIFERSASPRELGFALNLAPNAMVALREIGLADRLMAEGHTPAEVEVRGDGGRIFKRLNVARAMVRKPSVMALRQALHGALLDATDPATLMLDSQAVDFAVTDSGHVALTLGNGRCEEGDVLIGADGVGSVVRTLLHPEQPPLRPSGYYAVRGVAHHSGRHLGNLSAVAYLGHRIEAATVRASHDAIYWYMSLLAEDVPADTREPRTIVDRFALQLDEGFRSIVGETLPEDFRLDELFDREPISNWGTGPVTLLGDAAHPMLPHTGQGAAQALEDAVALGLALGSEADLASSLRRYERVRSTRTRTVVKRGRRIAMMTTTSSRVVDWLRGAALQMLPGRAMLAAFMLTHSKDPHRALRP